MIKIFKNSFLKIFSRCKIFATVILLLLGNLSEGVCLPVSSNLYLNSDLSSNGFSELNYRSKPAPAAIDETTNQFSFPLSAPAPTDPSPTTVCEGGTATFTVSGFATYQWQDSPDGITWTSMPGKTVATLTLNNVAYSLNGYQYRCLDGIVYTSAAATLTVNPLPVVTTANTAATCSGTGPNINLTASVASTFTWTVGTITGGITGASAGSGSTINQILTNPSNVTGGTVAYLVTPTSITGSCVGAAYTITVTVNPNPIVTNSPTASTCSGTGPNIALTSSVPGSFAWTVGTITGGITGASAGSGASINQVLSNPSNSTSGTVAYIVTPTATTGSCAGTPFTITVTVNPAPVVTTAATATICSETGSNISLAASVASTFTWTVGPITGGITGASAGSGTTINQVLTNPSNSTSGTVAYIVTPTATTGSCAGAPYTITVTVNPAPLVTTAGTSSTCSGTGTNINLTASVPSSFTWTIGTVTGGITGATSGSGSTINQILTNPSNVTGGTVAYLVTPTATTGSCVGATYTITVTVNPTPIVTNSPTASTCSGTGPNIALTSSVPGSFAWTIGTITGGITGASAGSGSTINQVLTNPSNSTSGTVAYIVTPTATTGSCAGTPFTITVTVNPAPVVTTAATATICSGTSSNINLTASVVSTFTWTVGTITGGITGASAGSGATINQVLTNPSGAVSGTVEYLVTPTSTVGSCVGATYTITVTVNPAPVVTTPNTATICSETSPNINLTASAPSSFAWTVGTITGGITGASSGSGPTINQVLTNPGNPIGGTVAYLVTPTATTGSCVGATYTITVTVNPTPIVTNSPTASTCSGAGPNIALTSSVPSSFAWTVGTITGGITGASAGSGATINQTLTNPSNGSAGTVAYIVTPTATTGSCVGAPFTITVTVNPVPVVTTAGTATTCNGTGPNISLTASAPSNFSWTIGTITGGITGASAGSGATINQILTNPSNSSAGTVDYIVTPTSTAGSCAGAPFTITVTVDPGPILTSPSTATICSGTGPNISLTASVTSTYTWTIGTITGGITGASSGSGPTINQVLTNPSTSTAGTVTYIVTPTSLTAVSCASFPITVTVNPTPVVLTPNTAAICNGTSPNISLNASISSNFTWTIGTITGSITGASAGSGSTINQILTNPGNASAGTVAYIVTPTSTVGSCAGTPYTITVTVNPSPIVTTPNTATICSGNSPNIALIASAPSNFSWTIGAITGGITGASSNSGSTINQVLTNPSTTTAGSVSYIVTPTATTGSCSGTPYTITVTVNPTPVVLTANTFTICNGTSPNIALTASNPSSFTWIIGTITGGITGAIAGSGATINQILTNPGNLTAGTVAYLVTPTSTTGSCAGATFTITVTVNPTPIVTNSPTASTCSGTSPNITLMSSVPSSFAWTIGAITGGITGASAGSGATINQILTNPGNASAGTVAYIVTPTSATGSCVGTPFTITVTVNPAPVVTTPNTATICSGTGPNIVLTASAPSNFTWTIGAITGGITGASAGSGTTINQVLTNPGNSSAGTVAYLVTPTSTTGSCVGAPYTITVTVNPAPVVTTASAYSICSGTGPNISLTASAASTFTWTVGTITGGITGASAGSGSTINQILTNPGNSMSGTVAYLVTPTATTGSCAGSAYTITVTVNPIPIVTNSPTASTCSGTGPNIALTSSVPSSFAWTVGTITGGITGASAGSGTTINQVLTNPSNTVAGTVAYIVTPTTTTGSCAGAPFTITVTIYSAPVVTTPGTATICSGTGPNIALTASAPSNFTWTIGAITGGITGASAGSGSTINQILTNPSSASAGTIEYLVTPTATTGSCSGAPYTITVTVNPAPVVTTSSISSICSGTGPNIALTSSVPSSFTWTIGTITGGITGASAGSGSTINQTLTNPSNVAAGTVAYIVTPTATTGSCAGTPYTITVTVNPTPTVTNSPTASTCSGAGPNIPLTSSVPSSFTWTIGAITGGITGASAGSGTTINQTLTNPSSSTSGTVAYIVTPTATTGSCTGAPFTITVTVNPTPIVTNSATANTCSGTGLNIALTSSVPSSFSWTIGTISGSITGAGAGSGSTINQILTNPSNASAGTVEYIVTPTATTGSCAGAPYTITVTVNPAPVVTTAGTSSTCSGTGPNINLTASVPSSFTWTIGTITGGITGATSGSGSTINQILTNPSNVTGGTVAYLVTPTATVGSCVGAAYTIMVTVNPAPIVTNSLTASTCSGTGPNIALTSSVPSSFAWTVGTITGGITGASAGSGTTINQVLTNPGNSTSGTVAYIVTPTATTGSCTGAPFTITVTVNPAPVVTTAATATICSGTGSNISLAASVASTFTWTVGTITGGITGASSGSGATINQILTNPSNVTGGTVAYLVTPTATTGSCVGTPYTITVTVNPAPIVTNSPTASTCSGAGPNIALTSSVPSNFTWTIGAITDGITGASAGSGSTINQILTNPGNSTSGTVAYLVTPTATTGSCVGATYTITVTVNPNPIVTNSPTASTCSGTGPNIALTSSVPSSFAWTVGTITGGITGASAGSGTTINQVLTNPSNSTSGTVAYIVTPTATTGSCAGAPFTITVTVNPAPVVTTAATVTICSGTGLNISLAASVASTFTWTVGTITGGITGASAGSGATINQVLTNPSGVVSGTVEYLVTPTAATGSCTGATYTITVTVNPAPVVTTPSTATICSGTSPNIALTSSLPSNFTWTIGAITGGITGATSGSGPTINQILTNPGNSTAGTVAYIVTPTATTGSCVGAPYTITVTVNPAPIVTNSPTASTCSGTGPNISLTASFPSSFAWTIGTITGGITGASAGSGSTINQVLTNPGNSTSGTVAYIVTPTATAGSCAGAPFTITVTVNPAPVVTTAATATICSGTGSNINLTASVASTFTWTVGTVTGGITGASAGSGTTINQVLTNPSNTLSGTVAYIVTPTATTGSCAGAPYTITVTVNPAPTLSSTLTPTSICSGTIFAYTATSANVGANMTWIRPAVTGIVQSTASGSGNISEFLTNSTALPVQVTYNYTTTFNGCSSSQNVVVIVNPAPVLSSSLTAPALCSDATLNYNATSSTPGATFSWSRVTVSGISQAGTTGTGNVNEILTNTTSAPIQVTYTYTISANGCTNPVTYPVLVTVYPTPPTPVITPSGSTTFCAGGSVTLTAPSGYSYLWSNGATTPSIVVNSAGSYSVVVVDANGCHSAPSASVITAVSPSATANAGLDAVICAGSSFSVSGASASNYAALLWSSSGSGTFSGNGTLTATYNPSAVDILNGSVVLTLTADNMSPCTGSVTNDMILTIQSAPTANAGVDNTVCYPNSFFVSGASATNFINPQWSKGSANGVLLGANTLTPTYYPDVADVGNTVTLTLTVDGKSPCAMTATDMMQLRVDALPGNPGVISGISPVCKGVTTTYSVSPISYATSYTWTLPLGATITSGNNTNNIQVNFGVAAVSGNISVYGANGCGNGPVSTLPVTVNDVPANPGSISGSAQVCQGTTGLIYSVSPVVGATSYVWTVPTGATITSTLPYTNSITVDFGPTATNGNITIYAANTCGNGTVSTKSIVASPKPVTPTISAIGGPTTFCEGGSVTLVGPTAGYNYLWTPGGATTQNNTVTVSGNYSVVITDIVSGCSSNSSNTVPVTVLPAPNPPTSIGFIKDCWDNVPPTKSLNANSVTTVQPGATLVWFDAATGGNVVASPILVGFGSVSYYAEAQDNVTNCPSLTRTPVTLTIATYPAIPIKGTNVSGDLTICETSPITTLTATTLIAPPAGTTINWFTSSTGGLPVNPTLGTVGTKTFYAEASNGICTSTARSAGVVLTITPAPQPPVSGGDIIQCVNIPTQVLTATATLPAGLPAGSTITWYDQPSGGIVVASPTLSAVGTVTYYAETKNFLTNCTSLTRTPVKLTIISHPAAPVAGPDIAECQKSPLQTLTATATVPSGSTIVWYNSSVGGLVVSPTLNAIGTKIFYAETDNGICTSLSRTPVTLTINAAPPTPVSLGNKTECSNSSNLPLIPVATAAGYAIDYYTTPTGGFIVPPTLLPLNQVGTATYYAEARDLVTGCTSLTRSAAIVLTVNEMPAPPVPGPDITACVTNPIQKLTATATLPSGVTLVWYSAAIGGSIVADPSLNYIGSKSYFAASKIGTCENATRVEVKLRINPAPATPIPVIQQPVCATNPIQTLTASTNTIPGATINFYTTPTGGSPIYPPIWNEVGTITYYAEALDNVTGCVSLARSAPIVLTINPTPQNPVSLGPITVCATNPVQILDADSAIVKVAGVTYTWYDALTAGNVIISPILNHPGTKTYYAEANINTCKSAGRTAVVLTINNAPAAPILNQTYKGEITACENASGTQTLNANNALLSSPGANIKWYDAPTAGFVVTVPQLNVVGTVTYYAEAIDATTGCPSNTRTPVILTINPLPLPPANNGDITECVNNPVQTLDANDAITVASGTRIIWYSSATGSTIVKNPTLNAVGTITYYVESVDLITGCISATRTPVVLTIYDHPAAPTYVGTGIKEVCETDTIVPLNANNEIVPVPGVTLNWFTAASAGFPVSNPVLNIVGSVTYWAEAVKNSCISLNRVPVTLTIDRAPVNPVSTGDIRECAKNPVQTLNANTNITNLTGGYSIIWYNAATGGSVVANPTLSVAGDSITYFAIFKDKVTGCQSLQRTAVKLVIAAPLPASAASNSPLPLGATLLLKGGPDIANLTYTWLTPGGSSLSGMDISIPNVTANAAGLYKLTVTNTDGCSSYDSTIVVIAAATADYAKPVCLGSTLYLSGGPDNMASYAWIGPDGFTSNQQNPSINNVTIYKEGDYTLTVIDKNGFSSSATVNVSFKSLPLAMASATPVCPGSPLNLSAGPNGMTSYTWEGPNGWTSNLKNPIRTPYNPSGPEKYILHVIDYNGCEASDTVTTTIFKPKASSNSPICQGDTLRLRAEPNGMTSYSWIGPNGFSSARQNPELPRVTVAAVGQYTLTVTDKTGCSAIATVTVAFNAPPPVPTITASAPVCEGSSLTLSGSAGMASYSWTGPNGFTSTVQSPQIASVSKAAAGTYTLTVTNANGCSSSAKSIVAITTATFNGNYGPYCSTDSPVTLSATPSGGTFSGPGVTGNRFDPSVAGVGAHTISYLSPGGSCPVAPIIITVVLSTPDVKTNNTSLLSCNGTADLTLPEVTAGSTPGLIFTYWTDSLATKVLVNPKAVGAGTYYIKGATLSGKCYDIKPVTVNPSGDLQAKFTSVPPTCNGSANGAITLVVTKGTAPYTYQWDTNPAQTTATIKDLTAGIYTVTLTDANLCSITLKDTLKDHPGVKVFFARKDIQCLNDANGSARVDSITVSGIPSDLNLYTYKWNTTPIQTTQEATRLSYGYQTVTITNANGCGIKDSVLIHVLDSIPPTIGCRTDTITIVIQSKVNDPLNAQNTIVVDLGKPAVWDNCGVATLTNDAPLKFRVGITRVIWTVTDFVGLTDTCSQIVYIKALPVIPQLISPNGDGINDVFVIDGLKDFPKSQLYIYTRSGQLVYSSENYKNDWDGRFKTSTWSQNQLVAPGVYYYILNLGGASQQLKGFVYVYY